MDELNSQFGKLSTQAKEFKPAGSRGAPELQPPRGASTSTAVKEFVPGQGWTSSGTSLDAAPNTVGSHQNIPFDAQPQQQQSPAQVAGDVTLPAHASTAPMPSFRALFSVGLNEDLWRYYRDVSLEANRQMDPLDPMHKAIPLPFCNGYCLDKSQRVRSGAFGYPSMTFQVTSREDGYLYCLRRFDNVRSVSPKIAATVMEAWAHPALQEHPGIVPLYQCFIAQRALFFVHQYIPAARTLKEQLTGALAENIVWSCLMQLVSAVAAVHRANLAVRNLKLHQVLCNMDASGTQLRVRIGAVGVVDALEFEARKRVGDLQQEDIRDLGRLIVSMATGTEISRDSDNETLSKCDAFLRQNFSRDLHSLAVTMARNNQRPPTIFAVQQALAERAFVEQDAAYRTVDRLQHALSSEYESGRGLRLLMKLGFVNERPELGPNRNWASSGDSYVLSLFRDYVFHQADGSGYPVMDLGHVVSCLNKLDAASEEKIVLASRDAKSLMIVTYADVARCLESAYQELCSSAVHPSSVIY